MVGWLTIDPIPVVFVSYSWDGDSHKAWVKKLPDAEFGMERGDIGWELQAVFEPGQVFLGGNS